MKAEDTTKFCSDKTMCKLMRSSCQDDMSVKGIIRKTYMNLDTGNISGYVIGYKPKSGTKAEWFGFHVCPFCTRPINQWMINPKETTAEGER